MDITKFVPADVVVEINHQTIKTGESIMYLQQSIYDDIRADPAKIVTYFNSMHSGFLSYLGMPGLSDNALKAAWCSIVAYGMAPYGAGPLGEPAFDLTAELASPTLNCASYSHLTWLFYKQFGLAGDELTAVGWDGGVVGNHIQLIYSDGTSNLLLDPTIGLVVNNVDYRGLVFGEKYTSFKSFFSRNELVSFNQTVISAISNGFYKVQDTFFKVTGWNDWRYGDFYHWTTTLDNGDGSKILVGSSYGDAITGTAYGDTIYGNKGVDYIYGGAGGDQMYGGLGSDSFYVDNAADKVYENPSQGVDTVFFSISSYIIPGNVENGYIQSIGSANITGNSLDNTLYAGAGNNIIDGLSGNDTVSYYYATGPIWVSISSGLSMNTFGSGKDTLLNIENIVGSNFNDDLVGSNVTNWMLGSGGNDSLSGIGGDDFLYGQNGDDTLYGGPGNDFLDGGNGAGGDQMYGGLGNDSFYVDNAADKVYENPSDGVDTVFFSISSYIIPSNVENGYIQSKGSANITGNSLDNTLYAGAGDNIIDGLSGNDTVSYYYATGPIWVSISSGLSTDTFGSGKDTLLNIENIVGSNFNDDLVGSNVTNWMLGSDGNDSLSGLGGDDTLYGGTGNDALYGGLGSDTLVGGDGFDTFVFNTALSATNIDRILDFNVTQDSIYLENSGAGLFNALTATGILSDTAFHIGAASENGAEMLIYNPETGALLYDSDGNGGESAAQPIAILGIGLQLTADDFLVI